MFEWNAAEAAAAVGQVEHVALLAHDRIVIAVVVVVVAVVVVIAVVVVVVVIAVVVVVPVANSDENYEFVPVVFFLLLPRLEQV